MLQITLSSFSSITILVQSVGFMSLSLIAECLCPIYGILHHLNRPLLDLGSWIAPYKDKVTIQNYLRACLYIVNQVCLLFFQ